MGRMVVFTVRILMTGEYEFFGCKMLECLIKEGHEVIFLSDRKLSAKAAHEKKVKYYMIPYNDDRCEEIFRISNIDMVIYNNFHMNESGDSGFLGGLVNLINLAKAYRIKKFITLYMADGLEMVSEGSLINDSAYKAAVSYSNSATDKSLMQIVQVALYNVYGPKRQEGVIFELFNEGARENKFSVYGNADSECVITYINDAVKAVYRVLRAKSERLEYCFLPDNSLTIKKLAKLISSLNKKAFGIVVLEENSPVKAVAKQELDWTAKFIPEAGLKETYKWFMDYWTEHEIAASKGGLSLWKRISATLENCGLFMLLVFLSLFFNNNSVVDTNIGLDYSYVYIAVMGLLYGKRQSLPATMAAMLLLTYTMLARGADLVGLFYQSQHIVHLASYLFVGVFTGYITDNHQRIVEDTIKEFENLGERYRFLEARYLETVDTKDKLYRQIINSNDSIGRVYQIVNRLSAIELEDVFTAANGITGEIMDTENVAIYVCGRSPYFLRLKTRSGEATDRVPKSLRIEQYEYLNTVINKKEVFTNRDILADAPDMATPVIFDNKVIAVIQLYDIAFENFDRQHEVLLKVTSMLIADALGRAYRYEAEMQEKKYIAGTRVLKQAEFAKLYQKVCHRNKKPQLLLKIVDGRTPVELSAVLEKILREEDYFGISQSGSLYLLMEDISQDIAEKVHLRIKQVGVDNQIVREAAI